MQELFSLHIFEWEANKQLAGCRRGADVCFLLQSPSLALLPTRSVDHPEKEAVLRCFSHLVYWPLSGVIFRSWNLYRLHISVNSYLAHCCPLLLPEGRTNSRWTYHGLTWQKAVMSTLHRKFFFFVVVEYVLKNEDTNWSGTSLWNRPHISPTHRPAWFPALLKQNPRAGSSQTH